MEPRGIVSTGLSPGPAVAPGDEQDPRPVRRQRAV